MSDNLLDKSWEDLVRQAGGSVSEVTDRYPDFNNKNSTEALVAAKVVLGKEAMSKFRDLVAQKTVALKQQVPASPWPTETPNTTTQVDESTTAGTAQSASAGGEASDKPAEATGAAQPHKPTQSDLGSSAAASEQGSAAVDPDRVISPEDGDSAQEQKEKGQSVQEKLLQGGIDPRAKQLMNESSEMIKDVGKNKLLNLIFDTLNEKNPDLTERFKEDPGAVIEVTLNFKNRELRVVRPGVWKIGGHHEIQSPQAGLIANLNYVNGEAKLHFTVAANSQKMLMNDFMLVLYKELYEKHIINMMTQNVTLESIAWRRVEPKPTKYITNFKACGTNGNLEPGRYTTSVKPYVIGLKHPKIPSSRREIGRAHV